MSTVDEQVAPPPDEESDGDRAGWWSASPAWAKAVIAGGLALLLFMLGAIAGGLVGRSTSPTFAPTAAGAIDVEFLQDMAVHHRQAVQMAVTERTRTTDPAMGQLAFDMESSQNYQVGTMEGWLWLWEQPAHPPDDVFMGWMGMPSDTMPGMATEAELAELRSLSGTALDVRFLQLMLRHHEGGFPMLEQAAEQAQVHTVRALAGSMLRTQTSEAGVMRDMLAQRGAAPLPSPDHGAHGAMDHGAHGGMDHGAHGG